VYKEVGCAQRNVPEWLRWQRVDHPLDGGLDGVVSHLPCGDGFVSAHIGERERGRESEREELRCGSWWLPTPWPARTMVAWSVRLDLTSSNMRRRSSKGCVSCHVLATSSWVWCSSARSSTTSLVCRSMSACSASNSSTSACDRSSTLRCTHPPVARVTAPVLEPPDPTVFHHPNFCSRCGRRTLTHTHSASSDCSRCRSVTRMRCTVSVSCPSCTSARFLRHPSGAGMRVGSAAASASCGGV
jgi:hypothetical protein